MLPEHNKGVHPEPLQIFCGHLRGHTRVAVPVSSDPGAETDPGHCAGRSKQPGLESSLHPGLPQTRVQRGKHRGEDVPEIMEHGASLVGEGGLFKQDFAGAPEPFERRLYRGAQGACLGLGKTRVGELFQQAEKNAVLVEHREPLGFRWVRRQYRFDPDGAQHCREAGSLHAHFLEPFELCAPGSRFGADPLDPVAQCSRLGRCVFLDHVEQLEGH